MPGGLESNAVEQRLPDDVLPFPPAVNSDGTNGALHRAYDDSLFKKKSRRGFFLLPVFVAAVLLLWIVHLCRLMMSRKVESLAHVRRLSGREEGEKEEKVAVASVQDICGALEGPGPSREEEAGTHALPPGSPAASSEPIAEEEQPRKRKRKTKWLEEAPEQQGKEARVGEPPISQSKPFFAVVRKNIIRPVSFNFSVKVSYQLSKITCC